MKIACIGWGSLISDSRDLLIKGDWYNDGPLLPIEFARQSNDGRLTLVIVENADPIKCLWVLMNTEDLYTAKLSLLRREGIPEHRMDDFIGAIKKEELTTTAIETKIQKWLNDKNLDAAIWTNLPPKFNELNGTVPTLNQVIQYLKNLDSESRKNALEYIKNAPEQVSTSYRSIIQIYLSKLN